MPLKVKLRADTGTLQISGTVAGQHIRRRPQSNDIRLAREEAAALEAEILRTEWHGERRGSRLFAEAALSYLETAPRSKGTKDYIRRILDALGPDAKLSDIDQAVAIRLRRLILSERAGICRDRRGGVKTITIPAGSDSTYVRTIVTPLRTILHHAADMGWCDVPRIKSPRIIEHPPRFLLPGQAEDLISCAAPHLRPLLIFLVGTGSRMSEALYLDWREVDLLGARATFWPHQTKSKKRRIAKLPPAVVAALANLAHREGPVFLNHWGRPYSARDGGAGGQIQGGWAGAVARSGVDPGLSPHDLRHTWASWHYARHRDPILLKQEGGWSSVEMVERYAHLLPVGNEMAIERFLEAA